MQEEFEKKIRERMHTFGIQPSHQVWDDIDAVLSKKKHRRVFAGWWVLLGIIAIGGGVLFFKKDTILHSTINNKPVVKQTTTASNAAKQTPGTATLPTPVNVPSEKAQNTQQEAVKPKKDNNTYAYQPLKKDKIQTSQIKQPAVSNAATIAIQSNSPGISGLPTNKKQPADAQTAYTPPAYKEPPTSLQANTGQDAVKEQPKAAEVKKPPQLAVNSPTQEKVAPQTNVHRGHQWFFTLSGGTTQTTAATTFNKIPLTAPAGPFYATPQNLPALTSLAALKYDIYKPDIGYHITAGGIYQANLSRNWRLSAGLQVTYLSNTQKTGMLFVNSYSQSNIYTGLGVSLNLPYYYQAQSTLLNTIVNKAWQLQAPVSLSYIINPKGKTKITLNGGVSGAWMFSSQWLIPDSKYGKLYYNKSSLNNAIFSWQAGPSLELHNQLQFGMRYEHSFTTLAKSDISPKLYWQNISIYVAVPFNRKNKNMKK